MPDHHVFGRGRDLSQRTHLVHVVEYRGLPWRKAIAFRDALRGDPELRERYQAAKEAAVSAEPRSRSAYNDCKRGFFDGLDLRC